MDEIIKPLKKLPQKIYLCGDYNITQHALILGLLAKSDICIRNYNRSKDTSLTISFLSSIGCNVERSATEIVIKADSQIEVDECAELEYLGGAVPLSQIIGYLAGKNICCSLTYSKVINPDVIDLLVGHFNKYGIDIFHEADDNQLIFRSCVESPIECTLSYALPYLKNSLLLYGLTRCQSISVKEKISTDTAFEKMIVNLGGELVFEEAKSVMTVDPDDPRKKIRIDNFDYKRKIDLKKSSKINGGEIDIPSDFHSLAAFLLLTILKKGTLTIENVFVNDIINRYIRFLKAFAADVELSNKTVLNNYSTYTLSITGHDINGRKLAAGTAKALMELIPYVAVAAAVGNGNTVIRETAEYGIWHNKPFYEISSALNNLGIKSGALEDGIVIEGKSDYQDDSYGPFANKETALAFYMLTLSESVKTTFNGFEAVVDNYPDIVETVQSAYDNQLLSQSA